MFAAGVNTKLINIIAVVILYGLLLQSTACSAFMTGFLEAYNNRSSEPSYTGGPRYDWDIFSDGDYRCRNISSGRFSRDVFCRGMPLDDDRWPG